MIKYSSYEFGRRLFAVMATIVFLTAYARGQENEHYNRADVLAAVRSWGRNISGFSTKRPTIMFATSLNQCSGCCATAVNEAMGRIRGGDLDANVVVVVGCEVVGEGKAVRKFFQTDNVVEDSRNVLMSVFHADPLRPDLYIIGSDGNVDFHYGDIQHQKPLEAVDYIGHGIQVRYSQVNFSTGVTLHEDAENPIVEAEYGVLDTTHKILSFIEPHQYSLYQYRFDNGSLERSLSVPDSVSLMFQRPDDDRRGWDLLMSAYRPLSKLRSIVGDWTADTLYMLGDFFTGYRKTGSDSGKTNFRFIKGTCLVPVNDGKLGRITPLAFGNYLAVGKPVFTGRNYVTAVLLDGYGTPSVDSSMLATMAAFAVIRYGDSLAKPVIACRILDSITGHHHDPRYAGVMCAAPHGAIYYINWMNSDFLMLRDGDGGLSVEQLIPRGALAPLFGPSSDSSSLDVVDISSDGKFLHVLLQDESVKGQDHQLIVQSYYPDGRYFGQKSVMTGRDTVLSADILGYQGGDILLLVKRKKGRWRMERLPLKSLQG